MMDFFYRLQHSRNLNTETNPEHEEDDDVFFAELRKQILLLTADEDKDEGFLEKQRPHCSTSYQRGSNGLTKFSSALQPRSYFNCWECENASSVPTWLVNLWRNGNGTGVFIPHIVKSRRYQPGRKNDGRRTFRRVGTRR